MANQYSVKIDSASSQYLSIPNASQTGLALASNFTIEGWFKIEAFPTAGQVIVMRFDTTNNSGYYVEIGSSGQLYIQFGTGASTRTIARSDGFFTTDDIGQWVHFAITVDIATPTVLMYRNGESQSFIYEATSAGTLGAPARTFYVGVADGGTTTFYDGNLDDLRIWSTIRTQSQIIANMDSELVGNESNLVAYWQFNNSYEDLTANNNDLTASGSPTFQTDAAFQARSLDLETSLSQYATIASGSHPGIALTSDFTLELWVKLESLRTQGFIDRLSSNAGYFLEMNSSGDLIVIWGNGTNASQYRVANFFSSADLGVWVHVAVSVTIIGPTVAIYKNTVAQSVTADASFSNTLTAPAQAFYLGSNDVAEFLDAKIDEVRIWNTARSASNISSFYNSEISNTTANLVGYWKLNNNYIDSTGNGNHLVPVATPAFVTDLPTLVTYITYQVFFDNSGSQQRVNFAHRNSSLDFTQLSQNWSPIAGVWYHVAVTVQGSTVSFYQDGALLGTGSLTNNREHNTNAQFRVGATSDGEYFDGFVDEVRVWNDDLSSSDISSNYNIEISGATASLVAYFKFYENLLDETANNNDLTAANSPTYTSNTPFGNLQTIYYPNHVLHRHSDGRLYIADVVDNRGAIHFIKTTKGTVEGDTNDGSTYLKLQFGYGLWPTALESYGEQLVIALFEGNDTGVRGKTSKLGFWDTTSTNVNSIIWVEFADSLITGLKNVNGTLYVTSTNPRGSGFRVSRLIGGYSFEDVAYNELGQAPLAGGIDGTANRLLFGSATQVPQQAACVWSLGLQKSVLGNGMFNIAAKQDAAMVTALAIPNMSEETSEAVSGFGFYTPMMGWSGASTTGEVSVISDSTTYDDQIFWGPTYRIGKPFQILKIKMPLAQQMATGMAVTPKIYVDGGAQVYTLTEANPTNDPGAYTIIRRAASDGSAIKGQHSFFIALEWDSTALCTFMLPFEYEVEILND